MTDFDSIWRIQDEIRTVVNTVLGECIWNLAYDERRSAIVLELTFFLDEDAISNLCCQFPIPADYDGVGVGFNNVKYVKSSFFWGTQKSPTSLFYRLICKLLIINI